MPGDLTTIATLERACECNVEFRLRHVNGGWVFDAGSWIKSSLTAKKRKKYLKPILEQFVARTADSELEEKDSSFVWHYRRVSPDLAYVRKEELKRKLRATLATDELGCLMVVKSSRSNRNG